MTGNSQNDHRLETYLTSLEKVLRPFPVSDRAEIVTEIKSHVLDALARDPQGRLDTVLSALGEPETVANRYLLERGMKPAKPPISPIVKWVVIGFLGTVAMMLVFTGFLISRFSTIVEVDDSKDTVKILNGLIKVHGGGVNATKFSGAVTLKAGQHGSVNFTNGKFEVTNSGNESFSWNCRANGTNSPEQKLDGDSFALDLTDLAEAKCEIAVPANVSFTLQGANGKLEFNEPHFPVTAKISNGKVAFLPDENRAYRYDLAVVTGKTDHFESSDKPDALAVSIHLTNGRISREN